MVPNFPICSFPGHTLLLDPFLHLAKLPSSSSYSFSYSSSSPSPCISRCSRYHSGIDRNHAYRPICGSFYPWKWALHEDFSIPVIVEGRKAKLCRCHLLHLFYPPSPTTLKQIQPRQLQNLNRKCCSSNITHQFSAILPIFLIHDCISPVHGSLDDPFPITKGHHICAIFWNIRGISVCVLIVNDIGCEEEWVLRDNFVNRWRLYFHLFTAFCKTRVLIS